MDRYKDYKECPKCGCKSFEDIYSEGAEVIAGVEVVTPMRGTDPVIIRTCSNCGFKKATVPNDFTEPPV